MEHPMNFARREMVGKTTVGALFGILGSSLLGGVALPSRAWALDLASLDSAQAKTLMSLCQTIAPHDQLEPAAYALVVKHMDAEMSGNAALKTMVSEGIAGLNRNGEFSALDESRRVELARAIEGTAFFQTMRVTTLQQLYDTPFAFALFGYEGEVLSKGGYLHRGFNDLRWLPDPPASAASPVPA